MFRYFCNCAQVVAVDRSDVAEAEILEDHPAQQAGLQGVLHLREKPLDGLADHRHVRQEFLDFELQAGVEMSGTQVVERFGQPAHAGADRHLVVVENDEEIFFESAGVVHGLEHDAAREGAVAHDGDDVAIFVGPQQIIAALHPERGADAATGVAGHEQVVAGFERIGVAHQAALAAHRLELIVPACDHLVGVGLMAGVPDKAVAGEVEGGVQRQGQFDHAEI